MKKHITSTKNRLGWAAMICGALLHIFAFCVQPHPSCVVFLGLAYTLCFAGFALVCYDNRVVRGIGSGFAIALGLLTLIAFTRL